MSVRSRAPSSIERDLREYAERAEERTHATLGFESQGPGTPNEVH